jgi:hypothetical protein
MGSVSGHLKKSPDAQIYAIIYVPPPYLSFPTTRPLKLTKSIYYSTHNADDRTFYFTDPAADRHRGPHNRRLRPLYPNFNRWPFVEFTQAFCNIECTVVPSNLIYMSSSFK